MTAAVPKTIFNCERQLLAHDRSIPPSRKSSGSMEEQEKVHTNLV
jgi:hypothetical protein